MNNQGFYFNKVSNLEAYLVKKGWELQEPKGKEVVRATKGGRIFRAYRRKEGEGMKEKAAIRHILNSIYDPNHTKIPHDALNTAIVALNEVQQYHKLGSLEELKERLTPKDVIPYDTGADPGDMQIIECPKCKRTYWMEDWGFFNFCTDCGQAINVKEDENNANY